MTAILKELFSNGFTRHQKDAQLVSSSIDVVPVTYSILSDSDSISRDGPDCPYM